jgi:hypothetical protein
MGVPHFIYFIIHVMLEFLKLINSPAIGDLMDLSFMKPHETPWLLEDVSREVP